MSQCLYRFVDYYHASFNKLLKYKKEESYRQD